MTTKEAKGMKFLKELTPDDMPFAGEVYERLKDYLIVKESAMKVDMKNIKRLYLQCKSQILKIQLSNLELK